MIKTVALLEAIIFFLLVGVEITSVKSYTISKDSENALALLNGVASNTPEMEVLIKDVFLPFA